VLRFDASANKSSLVVKSGVPASVPTAPTVSKELELYELGLYLVSVPAGSTSVVDSDISNVMLDETYCGIMRDSVTGIPTAQLQAQAEALINDIRAELGEVVSATSEIINDGGNAEINVEIQNAENGNKILHFEFKNATSNKQEVIDGVLAALPTWSGGEF
jgi:hypothetical protein